METKTETKPEKKIFVNPVTYKTLEFLANNKNMTVQEYADFLFKSVTTFDSQPEQNDPSIEVPLTPEQYAKLRTWLNAKDNIEIYTHGESKATLINERELWQKNHPGGKEVLGGEMIQLKITVFSPFLNFIREYLSFFGDKQTLETFAMKAVYDKCNILHSDLTQFAENKMHLLDPDAWYEKHSHLAITSTQPEEETEE
jgi:hypothetical protein